MSVRKWHKGKLIILWAWGLAAATFAILDFQTRPVEASPLRHTLELLFAFLVLVALSALTWHWLGNRAAGDDSA